MQPELLIVAGGLWRLPMLQSARLCFSHSVLLSTVFQHMAISTPGADPRMRQAAEARQVFLTSRSRPLTPQDLSSFDYLIGMDAKNVADIQVG
jgi:hypothetical protein